MLPRLVVSALGVGIVVRVCLALLLGLLRVVVSGRGVWAWGGCKWLFLMLRLGLRFLAVSGHGVGAGTCGCF